MTATAVTVTKNGNDCHSNDSHQAHRYGDLWRYSPSRKSSKDHFSGYIIVPNDCSVLLTEGTCWS